jgi:spermidine synthase
LVYAFAAAAAVAIAIRDSAVTTEERTSTTNALVPSLLATLLGGLILTVESHLAAAMLGDTAYARSQVAAIVCTGLGAGALVARSTSTVSGAAVWIHAGLAASVVATLPLWTSVPGYFASFRGYIDAFEVMGEFSQHEFIRLGCATFFLLPAAALAGLAVARTARWNGTSSAALALAGGAAGGAAGAFLLLPAAGSGWSLVVSAGLAIGVAAFSLPLLDGERRHAAVGALVLTAAALLLVAGGFDAGRLAADSALTFRPSTAGTVRSVAESVGSVATLHERAGTDGSELRVNGLARSRDAADGAGAGLPSGRSRALVLGVGSGAFTQALVGFGFESVTVTESSSAAADLMRASSPGRELFGSGKVVLEIADGRAVLQREGTKYDLILVDEPELSGPEAAAKCTSEFYALAAARLLPGGVLRQQLLLERLSPVALASVLASARKVFGALGVEASGGYATLVGCADVCPAPGPAPTVADDAAKPVRIDAEGIDDLLASVAKTLDVPVESLPAGDADLFLRYQTPVSFRAVPGEVPESRTLLESFAN